MHFSNHDLQRLRGLAAQQMEIANSPKMQKLIEDWKKHGTFQNDSRPMVTIELWTFAPDVIPQLLECHDEKARELEKRLLANIVNHTLFDDDTVVNGYMDFSYGASFTPYGLPVEVEHVPGDSSSLGHHFVEQLIDLEEDFHKLKKSVWALTPKEETLRRMDEYNDLLGDILPARLVPRALGSTPTQAIVHLMSMENMYFAMYDYPELFLKMMDMLADDTIAFFKDLADDGRLGATTGEQRVAQGSYCFTNRLPDNLDHYTSKDVWGYMDSQETSGLSPEMFRDLVFPAYKKIMAEMGRVSYGCCEAVDPIWESCLSQVSNLGKVSISPWCNEEYMGEQLAGREITYLRKPTPNLIGITKALDENEVREHFARTVKAAKGCWLEIVQRDVYKIYDSPDKVRRYVSLIRSECDKHQK
jgi:hypothetical protein